MLHRIIPSTGEPLPVIGLGTWSTFDVTAPAQRAPLKTVLQNMIAAGGTLIDTSPMYGHAEETTGIVTHQTGTPDKFFYATKVWTTGKLQGIHQMESSFNKMKRKTIDLMQIHNITDWRTHLQTLKDWKTQGKIRYIGITHYTDGSHPELERIITTEKIDFVQFNYAITSRHAEQRLLPAAQANGVATLINRPLSEGRLLATLARHTLPVWAADYNINSWAQFCLKFIAAHPAVTCIIPATANPTHITDNAAAGIAPLPDNATRKKMIDVIQAL